MYISLKTKIWIFVNLSVLSITVFTYFYFPYKEYRHHLNVYNKEIAYVAKTIATGVSVALSDGNFQGINSSMEYAQSDTRLKFVAMVQVDSLPAGNSYSIKKEVFRVYPEHEKLDVNAQSNEDIIIKRAPFHSDIMNGEIIIGFTTEEIHANVSSLRQSILGAGIFILLVSSLLSYFISTTITKPIHDLREASQKIGRGNLKLNISIKRNDELGDLAKAFDHMVKELDKNRKNIKHKKAELIKTNTELRHLNDEKNNLMGIVSHDLRSPLNQIKGLLSLIKLKDNTLGNESQNLLNQAEQCADRMNEMIIKILNIDAIESSRLNLQMERISLLNILEHLLDNFKRVASEKGIKVCTKTGSDEYFVEADKHYTMLIFDNLLSNAIKFSPKNSAVHINVLPDEDNGFITVKVQDEGPGISKEDQPKLFRKYQRLSAKPTAGENSIGLGLSIVKKYVEVMGGEVYYEDTSPGSTFVVKLKKV